MIKVSIHNPLTDKRIDVLTIAEGKIIETQTRFWEGIKLKVYRTDMPANPEGLSYDAWRNAETDQESIEALKLMGYSVKLIGST